MTNYFLTTAFGSSKNYFSFPLSVHLMSVYVLSSSWAQKTCCCRETWNIWVQFTSPTWNTIMFLRLGGLEKRLAIDAEWNVIALLLQLSEWGEKQSFQEQKIFPRSHFLEACHSAEAPLPHWFIPELFSSIKSRDIIRRLWLHRDTLEVYVDIAPEGTLMMVHQGVMQIKRLYFLSMFVLPLHD